MFNKKTATLILKYEQKHPFQNEQGCQWDLDTLLKQAVQHLPILRQKKIQRKEIHQHAMAKGSFIDCSKTQNQCVTQLSARTRNGGANGGFDLLTVHQYSTLTGT